MTTFEDVLAALAGHQQMTRGQTRLLSGLGEREVRQLRSVWTGLPQREKLHLLASLRRQAEADTLVDFNAVYEMAMEDPNADVRRLAIVAAVDDDRPELLVKLLALCAGDADEMVRNAAAERLAGFAYDAEIGKLSEQDARDIERVLLERVNSETEAPHVRASALASVGYFSTPEVRAVIRRTLAREGLRLAAIQAIGRNCDPVWTSDLIALMGSEDPTVRREAATAAADYEDTVAALADLVDDREVAVRLAAIASLGQIGGDEAREVLVYCYESPDPTIKEAAINALREIEDAEDPLFTRELGSADDGPPL